MPLQSAGVSALLPDENLPMRVEKAARLIPGSQQMAWQALELIAFVHFGVNTFTGREWGTGFEDPAIFDPVDLDARQWVSALKEAGFKQIILTAKHHDGFCLWPTRYSAHSVKHSLWRAGQGDVVREVVDAAREFGLKVGFYLSPADLHEIEAPHGRYGNGSPATPSLIPTPLPGDPPATHPTFTFTVDDYNRYYLNQLYELLTDYGPVHEVWFDGANPKPDIAETYAYADWFALVRALAPQAVMAQGPDLRWVGNEEGTARETEWSPLPFKGSPTSGMRELDPQAADLGSREKLVGADYLAWYPAEVDVSIRPGWFYHTSEDEQIKSLNNLLEIYFNSVGRNAVLLLNIPPNPRGRFAEGDVQRLHEFGAALRKIFDHPVAQAEGPLHFSRVIAKPSALDWILELPQARSFNCIMLQEDLSNGQRVEAFAIEAWINGGWQKIADGTTIGYKRLLRLDAVESQKVRLTILEARLPPAIAAFKLFRQ
jgi:alpha-L-fucosidase